MCTRHRWHKMRGATCLDCVFLCRGGARSGSPVFLPQVDVHPEFPDTKCFFVRSRDREGWEDFSYLKCLEARVLAVRRTQRPSQGSAESSGGAEAGIREGVSSVREGAPQGQGRAEGLRHGEAQGEGLGRVEQARSAFPSECGTQTDGCSDIGGHRSRSGDSTSERSLGAQRGAGRQPEGSRARPDLLEVEHSRGIPVTNGGPSCESFVDGRMSGVPLGSGNGSRGHEPMGPSEGLFENGRQGASRSHDGIWHGTPSSAGAPSNGHAKGDAMANRVESETVLYL